MIFEGHEVAIVGTCTTIYGITSGVFGKGWVKSMIHRYPIVSMSIAW
eukprot:CAMPEP_0171309928 /NCGR_PEP_ID=MMETSP0816-20121228/20120_1 /TAXON_ID=420281 /ORGANISM="Proboscia inermis, Strain CCAP1064/1" /LENGTH=46 /DNA_ID= /DNA_START= /DNA_END= /DNA_ORIENTATION=